MNSWAPIFAVLIAFTVGLIAVFRQPEKLVAPTKPIPAINPDSIIVLTWYGMTSVYGVQHPSGSGILLVRKMDGTAEVKWFSSCVLAFREASRLCPEAENGMGNPEAFNQDRAEHVTLFKLMQQEAA